MCFRTMGRCWKGRHTAREGRENSKTLKNHASVSSSYSERKEKIFLTSFFCWCKNVIFKLFTIHRNPKFFYCFACFKNHSEANSSYCFYTPVYFFCIFCRKSKFFYYIFKIIINVALLKLLIHVQHVYDVTKHGYVTMTSVPLPVLDIIDKI